MLRYLFIRKSIISFCWFRGLTHSFQLRLLAQLFKDLHLLVENVNCNREHWLTLEHGHIVSPMEILTNDIN